MINLIKAILILVISSNLYAKDFISLGLNKFSYKESSFESVHPVNLSLKYSMLLKDSYFIDFLISKKIKTDDINKNHLKLTTKINYLYGMYLNKKFSINQKFSFLTSIGFSKAQVETKSTNSIVTTIVKSNDIDFSYSLSLSYKLNKKYFLDIEYSKYINNEYFDLSGLSMYIKYKF